MLLFDDLLERIRNPNRVKHIDPAIEAVAKSFADDFGFPDRAPSLAETMQDAFNDWLDEQEQADKEAASV